MLLAEGEHDFSTLSPQNIYYFPTKTYRSFLGLVAFLYFACKFKFNVYNMLFYLPLQ